MLVYGDRSELADPRSCLDRLGRDLAALSTQPPGLNRHSELVFALIEAGRLLQGVADADFRLVGADRRTPGTREISALLQALAAAVCRSWDSEFGGPLMLPDVPSPLGLPETVELRTPEGFAYYGLYPEAYIDAARRLRLSGPPRVIGIRSIGTSLGALAAAALGAPPPTTVRPIGDPADRRLAISADLAADLLSPRNAHFVIVDEGPGRSGSSFASVAIWLRARRVPLDRIAFLPSHAGDPGPQATPRHRQVWTGAQRVAADLGPALPRLLAAWAEDRIGPIEGPLIDISAGAWRKRVYPDESAWPAVIPGQERRKFLASVGGSTWLLKFAGLGVEGRRRLACARTLHAAGLVPEPRDLIHGFLIERWQSDRSPLAVGAKPMAAIARYLGVRARLLPAAEGSGADLAQLFALASRNCRLALGAEAASALDRWKARLSALEARVRRVATDNRLDRHEWLDLPGKPLLKADAVDHHAGHDLIGCQDIAWDVAGAAVEFDLDPPAAARLAAAVGRAAGRKVDPELCEFLTLAYLAFRMGQVKLAAESAGAWPGEMVRLDARAAGYAHRLERRLARAA
ncbi:hypothetical protein [Sphingosinicella sp. CPCC 101087]|uniref:hypothetical protein n=1 Tax=Sphingosinicella sp. CPCC 101087 TaxID=2497754 RepID=UPI00101C8350|nr:hypothetical protein [Sphingosinicella sp. CPCC 101087]